MGPPTILIWLVLAHTQVDTVSAQASNDRAINRMYRNLTHGGAMVSPGSELRDGMSIEWDVPIAMDDGLRLCADVFRPPTEGRYPVIISYGPYAKGLAFQEGYP